MITRRTFLSVTLPALATARCSRSEPASKPSRTPSAQAAASGGSGNAPRLKITAAHQPNLCNVGMRIAHERGLFAAEGLEAVLLNRDLSGGHDHAASWVVGPSGPMPADLAVLEYPNLAQIVSGELDYYVVLGEHSGCRQLVVPVRSPIQTVADLKGKRIRDPANQRSGHLGFPGTPSRRRPQNAALGLRSARIGRRRRTGVRAARVRGWNYRRLRHERSGR